MLLGDELRRAAVSQGNHELAEAINEAMRQRDAEGIYNEQRPREPDRLSWALEPPTLSRPGGFSPKRLVRPSGLEPPRAVSPQGPQPCASTNSATGAGGRV